MAKTFPTDAQIEVLRAFQHGDSVKTLRRQADIDGDLLIVVHDDGPATRVFPSGGTQPGDRDAGTSLSWCQCASMDADCEQVAKHSPDGSPEPYLCDHCERASRGQGGEERSAGAYA